MADYQLTQTGNEVQTILNTVGDGKFVWLDSVDTALYDGTPQAKASWFAGYYDTSWTNRPTDYGLIYMMTVGNESVPWAYEYAVAVGGEAGQMFVRTTVNGDPWSAWKPILVKEKTWTIAGWQASFIARTNDSKLFIQIPATSIAKGTYSCTQFTYAYIPIGGSYVGNLTSAINNITRPSDDIINLEMPIPSGASTWTYGLVFVTSEITITVS